MKLYRALLVCGARLGVASLLLTVAGVHQSAIAAVGDLYLSEDNGNIERFSPDGTESTFATGLGYVTGLAFDSAGNLFAASSTAGTVYKFAPDGTRTVFATGIANSRGGLTVNSHGEVFAVANTANRLGILKFEPDGTSTTLDSGFSSIFGLTVDHTDNVYAVARPTIAGSIYKYTPDGVRSTFATPVNYPPLACDSANNIYAILAGDLLHFTPTGTRTTFASTGLLLQTIGCDAQDNLFVAESTDYTILKFAPDGTQSTFFAGLTANPLAMAIEVPEPGPRALATLAGTLAAFVWWKRSNVSRSGAS